MGHYNSPRAEPAPRGTPTRGLPRPLEMGATTSGEEAAVAACPAVDDAESTSEWKCCRYCSRHTVYVHCFKSIKHANLPSRTFFGQYYWSRYVFSLFSSTVIVGFETIITQDILKNKSNVKK
jgi:hypothetical protein